MMRVRIRVTSGWIELMFEMVDKEARESIMIRIVGGGREGENRLETLKDHLEFGSVDRG